MKDRDPNQIMKIDGKNAFFEVMKSGFDIGKVNINFIKYDPEKDNTQTAKIGVYIDVDKFLVFAGDVLSGRIAALGEKAKTERDKAIEAAKKAGENKTIFCKPVFEDLGGTSVERTKTKIAKAKENGKRAFFFDVPEGSAVARHFLLMPGNTADWVLTALEGIGKESETGLLSMVGAPKQRIMVPLSSADLKRFVVFVQSHIQAYLASTYIKTAS